MKTNLLPAVIATAFLFATPVPWFSADKEDKPNAEDLALAESFIVTGTVKQAIGSFSGHSFLNIGATFELDLSNLPRSRFYSHFLSQMHCSSRETVATFRSMLPWKS